MRLTHYPEGSAEHDLATNALKAVEACKDMQLANLDKLTLPDLMTRYNMIVTQGVDFPDIHKQHITKKVLVSFLGMGKVQAWSTGLALRIDGTGAIPPTEWDPAQPSFYTCAPKDKASSEAAKFKDIYWDTCLCQPFMNALHDVAEGGKAPTMLMKMVVAAIQALRCDTMTKDGDGDSAVEAAEVATESAAASVAEDWLSEIISPVLKVMRGIVCMVSPIPKHHGSSIGDVKYLFPDDGRSSMLGRHVGKMGRLVQAKVRGSTYFKMKKEAFLPKAGFEAQHGQALLDAHVAAESLVAQRSDADTTQERIALYKTFATFGGQWQKQNGFRKGATAELQANLVRLLEPDVQQCIELGAEVESERAALLMEVLAECSAKGADVLREKLGDVIRSWQQAESRHSVLVASQALASKPSAASVGSLRTALQGCSGAKLAAEEVEQLGKAIVASIEWASSGHTASDWRGLSAMWDVASNNGPPEARLIVQACRAALEVLRPIARLLELLDAWDKVLPEHASCVDTRGPMCIDLIGRAAEMQRAGRLAMPAAPDLLTGGHWMTFLQEVEKSRTSLVLDELADLLSQTVVLHKQKVKSAFHYLSQVCRGGAQGQAWYNGCTGDLMEHFATTLKVLDTKQIDTLQRNMELARHHCSCNLAARTAGHNRHVSSEVQQVPSLSGKHECQ